MVQTVKNTSLPTRVLQGFTAGLSVLAGAGGTAAADQFVRGERGTQVRLPSAASNALQHGSRRMMGQPGPASDVTQVTLTGCTAVGFLANGTIGNTYVNIANTFVVDTAQADTLVAATTCTNCPTSPKYPTTLSKLGNPNPVSGNWEGATWSGVTTDDIITLTTEAQAQFIFGAITSQTGVYNNASCTFGATGHNVYQGVLGMGPLTLSHPSIDSGFLWALGGSIPTSTFALSMCDNGGNLFLGGTPTTNEYGNVITTPLVNSKYYAIEVDAIAIGDTDVGVTGEDLGPVIIDSGVAPFILPQSAYAKVVAKVVASGAGLTSQFFANGVCIAPPAKFNSTKLPDMTLSLRAETDGDDPSTFTFTGPSSYIYFQRATTGADAICPGLSSSGTGTGAVSAWGRALMRDVVLSVDWFNKQVSVSGSQGLCD